MVVRENDGGTIGSMEDESSGARNVFWCDGGNKNDDRHTVFLFKMGLVGRGKTVSITTDQSPRY
jgi:hypothetical protein